MLKTMSSFPQTPVVRATQPRFGAERVFTASYEPLHVILDDKHYANLTQRLEQISQKQTQQLEASNRQLENTIQQGFQKLLEAMTASRNTQP